MAGGECQVGDLVRFNPPKSKKGHKETIFQIVKIQVPHRIVLASIVEHRHVYMIGSAHYLDVKAIDFVSVKAKFRGGKSCE